MMGKGEDWGWMERRGEGGGRERVDEGRDGVVC